MNIQSFVLYTDVRPILDLVPPEDGLPLLKAIFDYAAGEEVEPFQNFVTAKVWEMIRQIRNCIRKNNIDLSEDGAAAFLEDMRADNWTLYGKPVEKKTIVRVLREWAKRHGEYSARDPEEEDRAAAEKERRKEQAAQRIRQREEAEAAEKAAAEEEARRKREAEERRKEEEEKERKRPQLFADLLPVTKEHSRPDKVPEQLRKLLKRDNIPEFMLMAYCAAKDYFPAEMPVSDYPEEFTGQYCIPFWDKIRKEIRAYTRECGQRG